MNRRQFTKLLAGAGLLLAGCRAGAAPSSSTPERKDSMQTTTQTYTRTTPIETVRNDPVFGDYGQLIFPVERSYYSGDTLEQLHLTYYNNIDPDETVDICNTLRQRAADGQTIFYDIYTEDEKAADPDKADTGLFYFKGNPGAKFSICNAGGAFAYVGAMQDSFPHALELSRKEYNAFALIYRPGAQTACEDLARAIAFVFTHAEELEVDTSGYSLWAVLPGHGWRRGWAATARHPSVNRRIRSREPSSCSTPGWGKSTATSRPLMPVWVTGTTSQTNA